LRRARGWRRRCTGCVTRGKHTAPTANGTAAGSSPQPAIGDGLSIVLKIRAGCLAEGSRVWGRQCSPTPKSKAPRGKCTGLVNASTPQLALRRCCTLLSTHQHPAHSMSNLMPARGAACCMPCPTTAPCGLASPFPSGGNCTRSGPIMLQAPPEGREPEKPLLGEQGSEAHYRTVKTLGKGTFGVVDLVRGGTKRAWACVRACGWRGMAGGPHAWGWSALYCTRARRCSASKRDMKRATNTIPACVDLKGLP
jgi:hypothetical protein